MELYPFFKAVCDRDLPDFEAVAREITAGRHRRPWTRLLPMAAVLYFPCRAIGKKRV